MKGHWFPLFFVVVCIHGSALADIPEELTFLAAVDAIVDRNPEVASQAARVDLIRGQTLSTRLALLPALSLQARGDSRREFGLNETRVGAAAALDFNIFRFGSDWSAMKAAHQEILAEKIRYDGTVIHVESLAVDAMNEWLLAGKQVEILLRLVAVRENLLGIGNKRFGRGLIPRQEVDKLSIDWENDRAVLRDAETEVVRSTAKVEELLGHHGVQREWPWRDRLHRKEFPLTGRGEDILKERPDWKAAETSLAAAQSRSSQSWAKIFPSLDFNLTYGYYQAQQVSQMFDRPEFAGSLVLSIPLFDRLSNYGDYQSHVQLAKTAQLEWERTKRAAKKEWDSSRGALALSVDTAIAREKTVKVSRDLFQDNLRRFERGLIEANDLTVDQQRLLQSERLAVRGWAAAHSNLARLCFAAGLRVKNCF